MTDEPQTAEALVDRTPDALTAALSGSGMGSDTRAGSLQGGAASGSDIDPDQAAIDATLAREGMIMADPKPGATADADPIKNTGEGGSAADGASVDDGGGEVDAATG
ncbi:MAG: ribonuclease [Brevundimonas sp.]